MILNLRVVVKIKCDAYQLPSIAPPPCPSKHSIKGRQCQSYIFCDRILQICPHNIYTLYIKALYNFKTFLSFKNILHYLQNKILTCFQSVSEPSSPFQLFSLPFPCSYICFGSPLQVSFMGPYAVYPCLCHFSFQPVLSLLFTVILCS